MSNFIKIRRPSRSRMLRLQRILMIPTELRTSALCVRCAATSKNPIKPNDLLSFVFIFVVLVALSFRIFFPTVLQMVVHFFHFAHAPSWADFTPSPSASNVFSFFFLPARVYLCNAHSCLLVFWPVYIWQFSNKFIIGTLKTDSESTPVISCMCSLFVYLGARWPSTRWVGCLWAIERMSVWLRDEPRSNQHTVAQLCEKRHKHQHKSHVYYLPCNPLTGTLVSVHPSSAVEGSTWAPVPLSYCLHTEGPSFQPELKQRNIPLTFSSHLLCPLRLRHVCEVMTHFFHAE